MYTATGETWHYAEMAHRLAQAGVLTIVMRYSLYPDALVPHMVAELSQALTWAMDRASEYGGDPDNVSLVGHSAGAQMCAMALLHRAVEAARRSLAVERVGEDNCVEGVDAWGMMEEPLGGMAAEDRQCMADDRMPARFIGTTYGGLFFGTGHAVRGVGMCAASWTPMRVHIHRHGGRV